MKKWLILMMLVGTVYTTYADNQVVKKISPYKHETVTRIDESVRVNSYTFTIRDLEPDFIEFLKSKISKKVPNGITSIEIDDCTSIWNSYDECEPSIRLRVEEPVTIQITPINPRREQP